MLGLFWRFPLPTGMASMALLAGLLRIVRFARLIDHPDSGVTTI
jgi:hypothetical protein